MKTYFAAVLATALFFTSCDKNDSGSGQARLTVYLTDDPANYEAVYVDIQSIEVNYSTAAESGWESLPVERPGVYNLLDFQNGLDTVLSSHSLPAGKISQIRLVLGTDNHVKIDGTTYPLKTPSAQQSGLKLNIHADLVAGIDYKLWIDFDARKSIVVTGSDKFLLKPVIRAYTEAESGAIRGIVLPPATVNMVYAIQAADTLGSAKPDLATGAFLIAGLPGGTYTVAIDASLDLLDKVIPDVNVTVGASANIGTIELQ